MSSPIYMPVNRKLNLAAAVCTLLAVNLLGVNTRAASAGKLVDFSRDIRPILSDNCFHCHGPDEKNRKAKLRLDTAEDAYKDLGGYQAIKPKNAAASEVFKRIVQKDPDEVMPPPSTHKTLKPEQIDLIKRWIDQGGEYKGHWSFTAPVKPATPKVKNAKWARSPIDAFIAQKFEASGLSPMPEANKETLIRRVTFDLTGLPPTPQEVDAFLADNSPKAYEKVVERLLASPRYGEQMARYWLDAARYGDTHGLHLDNERSMWPYRDWVVRSFNANQHFDDFTVEQIAGDLVPKPTRDQLIATGFNRCNVTTSEGGSIKEEFIFRYAVDRTETTAAVWMGLTAGCAVCHDHKFDPISQKEFYQLYAFFNSAADPAMDGNILLTPPILQLTTAEQQKKLDEYDKQIAGVRKQIKEAIATMQYVDPATVTPAPEMKKINEVWVDDEFPAGVKAQTSKDSPATQWVTAEDGVVYSGKRALKRTGKGVVQDFFNGLKKPYIVPTGGKIYAYVYLDPKDAPKAVMLQFHNNGWSTRAVWGDADAIDFGKKGTTERMLIGPLPKKGEWVRLEFPIAKLGLKPGTKLDGVAFTQADGTVYWDKTGVMAESNPVTDIYESQAAWEKENQGKLVKDVPKDLQEIFRSVAIKDRTPAQVQRLRDYYLENIYAGGRAVLDPLIAQIKPIQDKRDEFDKSIPATLIMKDLDTPRDSFVMARGQYDKPGTKVEPGTPSFLPPLKHQGRATRMDLAKWLVDPQHPLTARVTVNRFWQQFFGTGLVKTGGDFGSQGQPPSHPQLMDWLATTFVASDWDVKEFVRLMVTSATYRQDSKVSKKHLDVDPENRLLARGPRFRLAAEEIRDNALFVSGLMNPAIGGKPVRPCQPENIWEPVAYSGSNTKVYKQDEGDALYRRSLYTFLKRTAPPPAMTTFDAPSRESFCVGRERSDTPLQALLLMNDIQHYEAARNLAQRMILEGGTKAEDRLLFGFRVVTARKPAKSEQAVLKQMLDEQLAKYRANSEAAKAAITVGASKPDPKVDASELAAYALVANLLLNLDETLTKN